MSRAGSASSFFFTGLKATGGKTFGVRAARSRGALAESLRRDRVLLLSARPLPGLSLTSTAPTRTLE